MTSTKSSQQAPLESPLAGLRVLECGDTLALAYAGRLLRDLGADVVKVEGPAGDPLRSTGPFVDEIPSADLSASFAYFHAGKRSVVVDLRSPAPELQRLVDRADVVLRSTRDGSDWVGDALVERDDLVVVDLSTFGRRSGELPATNDLLACAAGGLLSVNSSSMTDPDPVPLRYRGEISAVHAACDAVVATLGALFDRRRTGRGQRIDVSLQAAIAGVLATAMSRYGYEGVLPARQGSRSVGPWSFYRCRDGLVLVQCTREEEWQRFRHMIGDPEWADLEIFGSLWLRDQNGDALDLFVGSALADFALQEFLALAYTHRVAAAPIHFARDILEWDHLAARQSLPPVELQDGRRTARLPVPGRPWRFNGAVPPGRGASPRLGEATGLDPWSEQPEQPAAPPAEAAAPGRPLAGVRVLDLTWVWAGPFAAMQLAHLGADVVRVETTTRVDVTRLLPPYAGGEAGVDRSGYFNQYNQGKRSVALNLKQPEGLALLAELVRTCDVVIDNMSNGALAGMGFPYERLVELNPRIVAVSMTGFGESGPYADHPAYGSLIDALTGIASMNGDVAGGPTDLVMSLPDPMAGVTAAVATLGALYRAQATGEPVRVECPMLESCLAAFPWQVLYGAAAGHDAPVIGNRDELRSPHGCFPGSGDDDWLAISCEDDGQFAALAEQMGRPDLVTDPRFASLSARRVHEDALEAEVRAWTSERDAHALAADLRAAGIAAEPVARVDEVYRSPRLLDRAFFNRHPHAVVGDRCLPGVAWLSSRSDMQPAAAAPALGQHTREILTGLLGRTDAEVDRLIADQVTV